MSKSPLPTRAKIVIIGGGVGGTSVAFHLAELGEKMSFCSTVTN